MAGMCFESLFEAVISRIGLGPFFFFGFTLSFGCFLAGCAEGWRYGVPAGWTVRGLLNRVDDSQRRSDEQLVSRVLMLALCDVGEKVKDQRGGIERGSLADSIQGRFRTASEVFLEHTFSRIVVRNVFHLPFSKLVLNPCCMLGAERSVLRSKRNVGAKASCEPI